MSWREVWEKLQEGEKEKRKMSKLLNGRPIQTLKCDGRLVLVKHINGHIGLEYAIPTFVRSEYEEWTEILKPEPKADANGWWRFEDKQPEHRQKIIWHNVSGGAFGATMWHENNSVTWSHWKPFDGPVT